MTKQRSALSWTLSIVLHTILALLIIRTSYKFAFPEGAVESVSFEVAAESAAPQIAPEPQAPTAPEPAEKESIVVPKAPPQKIIKPIVIPNKPQKTVKAAEPEAAPEPVSETMPEVETQEESPVEIPQTAPVAAEPAPTETAAAEPETNVQEQNNEKMSEDTAVDKAAGIEAPEQGDGQQQAQATEVGEPRPAFGAPGSIIDETKLTERAGNRKPQYPWSARLKRLQGTVIIKAFVKPDGTVDSISLYQSSGVAALDKEALDVYAKWRYTPGSKGWVLKPFKFSLLAQ